MTREICNPEYLAKALLLKKEEKERLLSRMSGKLPRRLAKEKLTVDEALAIQLEIEDDQLAEWREKMHAIKAKEAAREQKKKDRVDEKATDKVKAAKKENPGKAVKAVGQPAKTQPVKTKTAAPIRDTQAAKQAVDRPAASATQAKPKVAAKNKAVTKPAGKPAAGKQAAKAGGK
jgi:hypothetical protein